MHCKHGMHTTAYKHTGILQPYRFVLVQTASRIQQPSHALGRISSDTSLSEGRVSLLHTHCVASGSMGLRRSTCQGPGYALNNTPGVAAATESHTNIQQQQQQQ